MREPHEHSLGMPAALLLGCGVSLLAIASPAAAQDSGAAAPEPAAARPAAQEEIVVTGSRIRRRDYESNSPIVTVDDELLQRSASAAIEDSLNKLPQFAPDKTADLGGDIQPSATNTPGSATVALRGIGANRTLVLLDGRRATPANANMVVDINSIPAAAIERVEIISGGASSTYGADAVAGVTNFILRRNFVGLELNSKLGITEEGDGFEYEVSGIVGTDFADDRGNVSIAFSHNKREAAYERKRDYFMDMFRDPSVGGNQFFPPFPSFQPDAENMPDQAVLNDVFGFPGGSSPDDNFTATNRVYFVDGIGFTGFTRSDADGVSRFPHLDGLNYFLQDDGLIGANFLEDYVSLPLERYNFFGRANYEINDWIGVFAQGYFNKTSTRTVQQAATASNGWSANVPFDDRPIPDELRRILESRPDPTADYNLNYTLHFAGLRRNFTDVYTYNMLAGFEGRIPDTNWTWEIYASRGESETTSLQTGFGSLQRYRTVLAAPDWGAGFSATGNPEFGGFGGATATCTSGINPFSEAPVSQDCIEAISADVHIRSTMQQTVWEANAQGSLFALPAGELSVAVGASYRENDYDFENETLSTQGRSFIDQVVGLYPSGNSSGTIKVYEAYGEALVPLLRDIPGIRSLSLELGGRVSDYNTTGTSFTYKILGDWEVTEWLRIRGGFNKAERAPNVAELFLAPQQTFTTAAGGDLCSLNNRLPYSAGVGNTTNREAVEALCRTLMLRAGPPGNDDFFYGTPSFQGSGAAFVTPTTQGNPNLKPETAETWTVGAVVRSPFSSPMLSGLRLTVDYYNIKVTDAIGLQTPDIIQRQCFDIAFNPALDPDSPFCEGVARNTGTGTLGNLTGTYYNNGRFRTSGVDVALDWTAPVGPGQLSINSLFNYLIEMKSTELADAIPYEDLAGGRAGGGNGLGSNFFRWKLFTTVNYGVGPINIGLQWRHLPSIDAASSNPDYVGAPAYDLFNLFGSLAVLENLTMRFGVDNLFARRPPRVEYDTDPPPGQLRGGSLSSAGSGSYYDLLGRRYYLGFRATL